MVSPTPGNNSSSAANLLRIWYKDNGLTLSTYTKFAYWALIQKQPDSSVTEGSTFNFVIQYNNIQARNIVFAGAQSQAWGLTAYGTNALTNAVAGAPGAGSPGYVQFAVTRAFNYAYASISSVLELQSRNNKGAFAPALTRAIQSSLDNLAQDQEISMFGGNIAATGTTTSQSGFIATIGTSTNVASSAGVLTLGSNVDIYKFSSSMELDLYYNNAGTLTKRTNSTGHGLFVGSVDFVQGLINVVDASGNAVAINSVFSNAATGDFICVSNDFNNGAVSGVTGSGKICSFESWIPFGGPVADSANNPFMGVNRNTGNIARLAGSWVDATGVLPTGLNSTSQVLNIEDAILTGLTQQRLISDHPIDTLAMSQYQELKLNKSNMNRVILPGGVLQTDVPGLGFPAFQVDTSGGRVTVLPSRFCAANRIYGLYMPSWSYIHLGKPVDTYDLDGMRGLREPMMDGQGFRFFSFGNMVCDEPAANFTINAVL